MMLRIYIASLAIVLAAAGAMYWKIGSLSDQLEAAEIRAQNAAADLSLAHAAMKAQSQHTARLEAQVHELAAIEDEIDRTDGANDPIDPRTLDFLRRLGLFSE